VDQIRNAQFARITTLVATFQFKISFFGTLYSINFIIYSFNFNYQT